MREKKAAKWEKIRQEEIKKNKTKDEVKIYMISRKKYKKSNNGLNLGAKMEKKVKKLIERKKKVKRRGKD